MLQLTGIGESFVGVRVLNGADLEASAGDVHAVVENGAGKSTPMKISVAQQHIAEIVKALSLNTRIVVMDEPTAALADHEVELLYTLVRRLTPPGWELGPDHPPRGAEPPETTHAFAPFNSDRCR